MPTYEYACGKCGQEFEVEQRITDPPVRSCPSCRSRKVKRLISQTSFVLKGGGWYSDLYASPGAKEAAREKPSESKESTAGKSAEGGSDKPAKTEAKPTPGKDKSKAVA